MTSVVITADIGGPDWYHVGDEAMFAANLDALRRIRPDVRITAVSRDPAWTTDHYHVTAVTPLSSSGEGADLIRALTHADALVLSGGGHLCSLWPDQIRDRARLVQLAHRRRIPVVVLGQTIGPRLDVDDRDTIANALACTSLIGVRGAESAALVASLGLDASTIMEQLDDAWFLNPTPSAAVAREAAQRSRPWIAVTLAPLKGNPRAWLPVLSSLGRQCSALASALDADLVFLPHWNAMPGTESDALVARRLFGFLDHPERATLLPVHTGEDTCWLTRQANLIVTTRYHPLVFGLSGRVPCVGIFPDEHTRVRQMECLRQAGLERYAISVDAAVDGQLLTTALSAWSERSTIVQQLDSRETTWRAGETRKWSRVAHALGWHDTSPSVTVPLSPAIPPAKALAETPPSPATRAHRPARPQLDISAVVLTRNGARRLERCLQSVVDAGVARELIVFVDAGTHDESEAVAQRFTSQVFRLPTHGYIEASLAHMAAACAGAYVLRIDDDETLGGDWQAPLHTAEAGGLDHITHVLLPRRWLVPGADAFISSGEWFPDLQLRLFRNDPALLHWPAGLHDHLTVDGPGIVLWDRWIDHHVLWQQPRSAREAKCDVYRRMRPDKDLSHFYLWEEQAVSLTSTDPGGAPAADPLDAGANVSFGADGHSAPYRLNGWSLAESWGTWTDGAHAVLRLPLKRPVAGPVTITLRATAFVHPAHPCQRISVTLQNHVVAEWCITSSEVADYPITIPPALAAGVGVLVLTIRLQDPMSPRDVGESADARRLGLGVHRLRISTS